MPSITYRVQGMAFFGISIRVFEIIETKNKIDTDCIRSGNKCSIIDLIIFTNDIDIFKLSILVEDMENDLCKIFG